MRKLLLFFIAFIIIVTSSSCLAQVATGQYSFGTFDNKGFDTINLGNLNVIFKVPIIAKKGRAGTNFTYQLDYNSSIWTPVGVSGSQTWTPTGNWGWAGETEALTGSRYLSETQGICSPRFPYTKIFNVFYIDPSGASHRFAGGIRDSLGQCSGDYDTLTNSWSTDGKYQYTDNGIKSRTGILYDPSSNTTTGPGTVTDSNGNQLSTDGNGNFTDTTGNVVLSISGTAPSPQLYIYKDTSGNSQSIQVTYTTYSIQTNFGCSGVSEYSNPSAPLITAITYPDGSSYQFIYETTPGYPNSVTGRIASVTLRTGGKITYTYTGGSNGIMCSDGSTAGLIRTLTDDPAGAQSSYVRTIGANDNQTIVTDGLNNQTNYTFVPGGAGTPYESSRAVYQGSIGGTPLLARQTCYNAATPDCTSQASPSYFSTISTYEIVNGAEEHGKVLTYNNYGLLTNEKEYDFGPPGAGGIFNSSLFGSLLQQEVWTYPTSGIPGLLQSDIVYDGSSNIVSKTTYGYDETAPTQSSGVPQHVVVSGQRGNLTSVAKYANSSTSYTTSYTYEDTGSVLTSTSPTTSSGATTTYTYDPTFVYNTGVQLPTPSSGISLSSSQSYDQTYTGVPKTFTDANGKPTTVNTYDSMLRPTDIGYPDGGDFSIFYSSSHNQIGLSHAISSGASTNTQILYDGYGRVSRVAVYLGSTINQWYQKDTCYDADGRVSFKSYRYQGNGWGTLKVCSGAGDAYTYDALGRLTSVTHGDATSVHYIYSGHTAETTDENGISKLTQSDALGRTTAVCEVSSTTYESDAPSNCSMDISGTGFLTTYAYAAGQTMVTQGAQTRVFKTDWLGRPTSVQEPELQQAGQPPVETTYSYPAPNATGPVMTRTRPKANQTDSAITTTTTTQYDALGRVVSISYDDGTPAKSFLYDQANAWGSSTISLGDSKGRLTSEARSVDGNWTGGAFGYDSMGRVTMMLECVPSRCGKGSQYDKYVNYTYDWLGDILTATDGAGVTTSYTYTPVQEVENITSSLSDVTHPGALVSNVQYGPFGPLNWQLGNGLYGVRSYDALGRNNGGWVCSGTTQTFCTGGTQTYGYTDAWSGAQSTQICDTVLNRCSQYSYDDLNRVASQTGTAPNFTYVYDRYGNRWEQNVTAGSGPPPQLSFDKTTNRINSGNYQYDAAGNLINDGFHAYTYDADGNVIAVDGGATATYTYNALNQRVRIDSGGDGQEYAFNLNGQRVSSWDVNTGNQIQGQVYWGSAPIEFYQNGAAHFQHLDGQSTERAVTSYNGSVEDTFTSLAFGDGYSASGSDSDPYHFAMLDKDYYGSSDSGTDHAKFRLYSDVQGRWMSPDPYYGSYDINNPQSMNRYAYVLNNPLVYVDPDGTSTDPCAGAQACVRGTPPPSPPTSYPGPNQGPSDGQSHSGNSGGSGAGAGGGQGQGQGQGNKDRNSHPQPQNPQQQPVPSRFSRNTCFYLDWGSGYLGALSLATFVQPEAAVVTTPLAAVSSGAWLVGKIGGC